MKHKIVATVLATTAIFFGNALWLRHLTQSDRSDLHASPLYSTYVAFRTLFLQPRTIMIVGICLSVWLLLIYRKTRKNPLADHQKIILTAVVLSVIYGFVLLASFNL